MLALYVPVDWWEKCKAVVLWSSIEHHRTTRLQTLWLEHTMAVKCAQAPYTSHILGTRVGRVCSTGSGLYTCSTHRQDRSLCIWQVEQQLSLNQVFQLLFFALHDFQWQPFLAAEAAGVEPPMAEQGGRQWARKETLPLSLLPVGSKPHSSFIEFFCNLLQLEMWAWNKGTDGRLWCLRTY